MSGTCNNEFLNELLESRTFVVQIKDPSSAPHMVNDRNITLNKNNVAIVPVYNILLLLSIALVNDSNLIPFVNNLRHK